MAMYLQELPVMHQRDTLFIIFQVIIGITLQSEQAVYNFSSYHSFSPILQNLSFSSQLDEAHSQFLRKPTDQTPAAQHPSHDSKIATSSSIPMHSGHSTPKHTSTLR